MTQDQFEALVNRLSESARRHPRLYQFRVLLLGQLGNLYLGFILLFLLILFVAALASVLVLKILAVKLVLIIGVFISVVLRSLRVRMEPPEGERLRRREAPELFAMIDDLRRQLRAPRFHQVLITDDLNAAVLQLPRLGILGWHRNYLLLGLPLMKTLSREQFKAVVAHEFGHLAGGHGRLTNGIYRQRLRWSKLMAALEANRSHGSFLFKPFLKWYAPYFNAYSFPLARTNEYQADAASARLTSPRAAAEALTGVNVISSYLGEQYWPQIHRQADEVAQPQFLPFTTMGRNLADQLEQAPARHWLDQAMGQQTSVDDTHPALKDRLAAIGETPRLAPPHPQDTADQLLGPMAEQLSQRFDQRWREQIAERWTQRYEEVQTGREQLAELDARVDQGETLPLEQALQRAHLTESIRGDEASALAQFRQLHERQSDSPVICYNLGIRLLDQDDECGCHLLEEAIRLDDDAIIPSAEALRDYHWRQGRKELANHWHQILVERTTLLQSAREERNRVLLRDKFLPHGLPEETRAQLRQQLKAVKGLRKAYLVQKRVKLFTESPCYVLGFRLKGFHFRKKSRERLRQAVVEQMQAEVTFPGETILLCVDGANYRFGRKMRWRRGARIL